MKQEIITQVKTLTAQLLAVPFCCAELKDAANNWLAAVGTDREASATAAYIEELEEDVMSVDDVIGFFSSPAAAEHMGKDQAEKMLTEMIAHKAAGGTFCPCPACSAGAAILVLKEDLLG